MTDAGDTTPKPRKLHVKSFGCQMNVYDSQRMADLMAREGYTETARADEGDAVLEGIARVIGAGVQGYRAELALRASNADVDVAALANRLAVFGLTPAALSVGILRPVTGAPVGEPILRFSFLLLDDDDDAIARLTAREGAVR